MGMSLSDIEAKAENIAESLMVAGKSEALLLGIQLEGLRDLAQIKQIGSQQAQDPAQTDAFIAAKYCLTPGPGSLLCWDLKGHAGPHGMGNDTWSDEQEAEPTKPAADRLHELMSYLLGQCNSHYQTHSTHTGGSVGAQQHLAASKAYDDAAQKLDEILREGGI